MPVLWVRDLASGEARALNGTEGAYLPFWSPDSRELGFGAGGFLKRVAADGGPVQVVRPYLARPVAARGRATAPSCSVTAISCSSESAPRPRQRPSTPVTTLPSKDWSHY